MRVSQTMDLKRCCSCSSQSVSGDFKTDAEIRPTDTILTFYLACWWDILNLGLDMTSMSDDLYFLVTLENRRTPHERSINSQK